MPLYNTLWGKKAALSVTMNRFCYLVVRKDWFGPVELHSNLDVCNGFESVKNNKEPCQLYLALGVAKLNGPYQLPAVYLRL